MFSSFIATYYKDKSKLIKEVSIVLIYHSTNVWSSTWQTFETAVKSNNLSQWMLDWNISRFHLQVH